MPTINRLVYTLVYSGVPAFISSAIILLQTIYTDYNLYRNIHYYNILFLTKYNQRPLLSIVQY